MQQPNRIRDPIHGLIVFEENNDTDRLAWRLIQTPEFQRLRRIKQLGVSELVFPGATHSRFAHSVGVYCNARRLMKIIERAEGDRLFDKNRAQILLIAALLHDLGHGPFSHAFENARKALAKSRGAAPPVKHEILTADLILAKDGHVRGILGELAEPVAAVFRAEDPVDIYHAVVSSSFDADRLDYLVRDRYMTGSQAGTIDIDWLMDNLDTAHIDIPQDDDEPARMATFVFKEKARQAAEDFLLARYRLYTQVYLHKTTRGFEQLITALIQGVGERWDAPESLGLDAMHPLIRFLRPGEPELCDYRDLDDTVVWGAIERFRRCGDRRLQQLAERLWCRQPLKVLDVTAAMGLDRAALADACARLNRYTNGQLGLTIFRDDISYDLYSVAKADAAKEHKKVRVRTHSGGNREISEFPDTVISDALKQKRALTRFYFLSGDDKDSAEKAMIGR